MNCLSLSEFYNIKLKKTTFGKKRWGGLDGLNKLIDKAQENPEILEYMRLAEKFSESAILPIPSDRLIRTGEAAKILGVNPARIREYADKKILTKLRVEVLVKRS